jgi:hypothetical protein
MVREMTCFAVLGWQFPVHIFDQHTAYLAASNILLPHDPDEKRSKPRKRLPDACRAYGIKGWDGIDKHDMQAAIGNGTWHGRYSPQEIMDYCEEDVRKSTELLRAQLRPGRNNLILPDTDLILHWSNYSAKCIALIQMRGMPIDMAIWNAIQENKLAVIDELRRRFDPSYGDDDPIYNEYGEWSRAALERWLVRNGVYAWPRNSSGMLSFEGDDFRLMYSIPGIERLHALRDSIGVITRARLPIGRDGRNRPSLFPFGTATGRNAHAKSIYNAHAGMRSLMVFPPNKIGLYLDWRTQEVGIAAALCGDPALMESYGGGDVYYDLAVLCGLTCGLDRKRWKKEKPDLRQRMKSLQLAINYGMGVPSLAKGIDRHPMIASTIIEKHRETFPRFWGWRTSMVAQAMLDRHILSEFNWPLRISTSPNKRTLYNFPMQANGAEMLRLAAWRLCEAGLVPSMLVHDGILLEVENDEQKAHAIEIMRAAGRDVCDGFEIGVDADQTLKNGARYTDKRAVAKEMWQTITDVLRKIGAVSEKDVA